MLNTLRYATLGAALLAGTAVTHAQTVIMPEPAYVAPAYVAPAYPAPVVTVPAAPVIAPAPEVVVTQPAPVVVPAAPVAREIVTPAPQTVITQPQTSVQETVVRRSETRPATTVVHRRARTTRVHLTRTQRREVLRTIRYQQTTAPVARVTTPISYRIGSVLPATVPTYAMPREVVYEAPALAGYAYAPVGDRVLVVEPASNVVVSELY